jgi:energy-converting hydrogenase B subunit D
MLELLIVLICISILVSAALAVLLKSTFAAVVTSGLAGLFASVCYVLLAAPDVAMAEASIGAGLATLIFLFALRKTGYPTE